MQAPNVREFVMAGHPVFPCEGKAPVKGWKWRDVAITSHTDPRLGQHTEWGWPTQNYLVTYDIDKPELWPYAPPEELLSEHAGQRTPSGGYHIVVIDTDPEGQPAQVWRPWGEIRRHGTYHRLYGPNQHWLAKDYLPMPEGWDTGRQKKAQTKPGDTPGPKVGGLSTMVSSDITKLIATADITGAAEEGNRNVRLTQYAGLVWSKGRPWLDFLKTVQAKNAEYLPPLDDEEVLAICRSVARYERTLSSELMPAQPGNYPPVLSAQEVATGSWPEPVFWLDCWGPGQAVLLHGYTGSGKSLYALHIARLLARRGQTTLILDGELTMGLIKKRLGPPQEGIFWATKEWLDDRTTWLTADYSQYDHIVIDTKAALYRSSYSENEAEHWQVLVDFVYRCQQAGICVTIVHHSGKDAGKGARGSSAGQAPFDSVLHIGTDPEAATQSYKIVMNKDRHCLQIGKQECVIKEVEGHLVFVKLN